MKKYYFLFILFCFFISGKAQYGWFNKNLFPDSGFLGGAAFVIDGMGYITGGLTSYAPFTLSNQTWQYNPTSDTWTQKASYPYKTGGGAFFSVNGYGYQIGGVDTTELYNSNNYMYDPVANTWTQKSPFPEDGIGGGFYFVINGIAYVGAGARNSNEHGVVTAYSYNPVTDTWAGIANYPGNPSISLCAFSIDSFGYAGMGGDGNGSYFTDMYKYNPAANLWTQIAPFPGKPRFANLSAFVVNDKAYVGTGQTPLNGSPTSVYCLGDYYTYDPVANIWSPAPGLQGPARYAANALSFGDSAYLIGGYNQDGGAFYNYVDEFKPVGNACLAIDTLVITVTTGIAPNTTVNNLDVYPNPGHNQIYINTGNYASMSGYTLNITNTLGQSVFSSSVNRQLFAISTSTWSPGVYFLQVINPNNTVATAKEIVVQ